MKYLNKLFALDEESRQEDEKVYSHKSSTKLTSALYSVIFAHRERSIDALSNESLDFGRKIAETPPSKEQSTNSSLAVLFGKEGQKVDHISAQQSKSCQDLNTWRRQSDLATQPTSLVSLKSTPTLESAHNRPSSGNSDSNSAVFWRADIDCAQSVNLNLHTNSREVEDDDWVLIDEQLPTISTNSDSRQTIERRYRRYSEEAEESKEALHYLDEILIEKLRQMALDATDLNLVKASWLPVKKDPKAAGVLLFKGLFTKFPQYIKFFPQFADLDLECLHENKRLLRHATKVIDTVSFVVDSIGDETKANKVNDALINTVKGHLKRKVGLAEFRNLGIVLIDFICDVNHRIDFGSKESKRQQQNQHNTQNQLSKSSSQLSADQDSGLEKTSETMTSVLDKVRASSSPSSSSEEESFLVSTLHSMTIVAGNASLNINNNTNNNSDSSNRRGSDTEYDFEEDGDLKTNKHKSNITETKINTNALVAAWTKLYSSILDLVEHEEAQHTSD